MRPLIAALTVLTLVVGGCVAEAGTAADPDVAVASGTEFEIVMTEMAFTPSQIRVPAGERITIHLVNEGNMRHDLFLDDGTHAVADPGERVTVEAGPFHGSFEGVCMIPGHEQAGMVLTGETE